jgi:hypothetical protein
MRRTHCKVTHPQEVIHFFARDDPFRTHPRSNSKIVSIAAVKLASIGQPEFFAANGVFTEKNIPQVISK